MVATVELRGGRELQRISRELRRLDNPELKKRFRRELTAAGRPMVPLVQNSIRNIPAKRPYSPSGLRGRMVKATRLEVRTANRDARVTLRVDGRRMPNKAKAVQSYMEGVKRPWRHPVYGNREVWVVQSPHPYFFHVVRPLGATSRQRVNMAIDRITREIS